MITVGISPDYSRVGLQRDPEEGEVEISVYPTIAAQGKKGHFTIGPDIIGVAVSVNGAAPEQVGAAGSGHWAWHIDDIGGQRILLRYDGGAAGAIPVDAEVTVWAE